MPRKCACRCGHTLGMHGDRMGACAKKACLCPFWTDPASNPEPIENAVLEGDSIHSMSIQCSWRGARYHFWLKGPHLAPESDVLYKNAEEGAPYQYDTRLLDKAGATGRLIVPSMQKAARKQLPILKARWRAEKVYLEALAEDEARDRAIKEAARDLLRAAKALRVRAGCDVDPLWAAMHKAIAKAEKWGKS